LYFSNTTLLILAGLALAGLALTCFYSISALRRARRRLLLCSAREEQQQNELAMLEQTATRLRSERSALQDENRDLTGQLAALQTALAAAEKQADTGRTLLEATRKQLESDFQILADRIFTEKGQILSQKHQTALETLLNPVREQLGEFKKKVEDVYDRESRDRISLVKEIEHLKTLNQQIGKDAVNLTNALKGQNKVQGLWGEMILERLLEDSGLQRGHEFDTQVGLKDKNGRTRLPDVIIHLPKGRDIIIDAKVSLAAFEQASRAETPEERQHYLQDHLDSLKKHIHSLAGKEYHLLPGVNCPDFVLLFMPTEGAFQTAVSREPELLTEAMRKKIILASPSTLLAILRTINHMWRQEEQNRNSLAIAKQAGNLYDKFIGFVEALEEVGGRLNQTVEAWQLARKRLTSGKGNLISRAEALRKLGVQNTKRLPSSVAVEENEAVCPEHNECPAKPEARETMI